MGWHEQETERRKRGTDTQTQEMMAIHKAAPRELAAHEKKMRAYRAEMVNPMRTRELPPIGDQTRIMSTAEHQAKAAQMDRLFGKKSGRRRKK